MSNLLRHADTEFAILMDKVRADNPNDPSAAVMQEQMHAGLRETLALIAEQGHSGFSIGIFTSMLTKLAQFDPLSEITGEDSEWTDVSGLSDGHPLWQNKRCTHLFKEEQGRAYDTNGIVAVEESGCGYTGSYSVVYIDFPYTPTRSYITHPDDNSRFERVGLTSHKKKYKSSEEAHGAYADLLENESYVGKQDKQIAGPKDD